LVVWPHANRRSWRKATSSLACVVAVMASGCAEEAVDPASLPETVDVASLRGAALPGTECRFARDLEKTTLAAGEVGSRVWLRCPDTDDGSQAGFVEVQSGLTGYEPPEDRISCRQDGRVPSLYMCGTRHRMTVVNARAVCGADPCGNSEERARRLMASLLRLLASLTE
jgi:hypothetical protein